MKTENEFKQLVYAVLSTLGESGGWCPCSSIYLAAGMDLQAFEIVRDVLVNAGLVTATSEVIELTPAGHTLARKLNLALKATKQPQSV